MVVSWGICTLGTVIVAASTNIYMVAVGLFLADADVMRQLIFAFSSSDRLSEMQKGKNIQYLFRFFSLLVQ